MSFERHRALPLTYKGASLREADEIKLLVGGRLLVNPMAAAATLPLHQAQLLSQLRLGNWNLGLLLNFNTTVLPEGIRRVVLSRNGGRSSDES